MTATMDLAEHIDIQYKSNLNAFVIVYANFFLAHTLLQKTNDYNSISLSLQTLGMETASK